MKINAWVSGKAEAIERLGRLSPAISAKVMDAVRAEAIDLQRVVKLKLSDDVLHVRTGRLRASINVRFEQTANRFSAYIGSNGVPYAAIHEYGGTTPPHVILPKNGMALHFFIGGKEIFAARVNHPGSKIPMRSYLRSSINERRDQIIAAVEAAAAQGAREA